jgi:predicted acyl esterase
MAAVLTSQAKHRSEIRDGMHIDWDIEIPLPDGTILRADVFRPVGDGRYPVIMSMGPYAKGLSFQEAFKSMWDRMVDAHTDVPANSSNLYQNWEVVDPEKWVPEGYACVRVDSRGAGTSPGVMNVWSPQEAKDFYECIEWGGTRPWSNGKVGLSGISYYAMNQWQVASLQPPHLAAICVWEGAADFYRDVYKHGGIINMMPLRWYPRQVLSVQHGLGTRGRKSVVTGDLVAGPETLSDEELAANRGDLEADVLAHPLFDDYYKDRNAQWDKVTVPLLSAGNWGGQGLHTRGNFEGYLAAASKNKWLEVHGRWHWPHYYTDYGRLLQQKFFDYFLKGEQNGWDRQAPVQLQVRHPGAVFVQRLENEWPLARTQWTKFYLDPATMALTKTEPRASARLDYDTTGDGLTFTWKVEGEPLELTGPSAARLFLSSKTADADVFLVVRVYDHHGKEVTFNGALDPQTPVAQGWLRASQRKLDPAKTLPHRPYHAHDEKQPLTPGEACELDVEILPTCIVIPQGYEIRFMVRGKDHHCDGAPVELPNSPYPFTGVGPFHHTHPQDRPAEVFSTTNTLHFAPGRAPFLLLPVIPGATLPC